MAQYKTRQVIVDAFRLGYEKPPDWFLDSLSQKDYETFMDGWVSYSGKEHEGYGRNWSLGQGLYVAGINGSLIWVLKGDYICKNQFGGISVLSRGLFERTHVAV